MNHLLSVTILLFAVWPAYYLLLRYSDRYSLNRLLLLLVMVAVVTLPFINFSSPAPVVTQSIQGTISYLEEGVITGGASIDPVPKEIRYDEKGEEIYIANRTAVTIFLLPKMYYLGLGLLALVLGFRLLFIFGLHLRSRPNGDGSYRLLHLKAKAGQAFTFGHNLYFSTDVPNNPDFDHILTHEGVHARQLHSLDILLSEVFLCIFWFHPAAWWLRAKMRANLEFLVDKTIISSGADRRDYQLALVRQSHGAYGFALALPFSEPSLKSRIVRMTGLPEYRVVGMVAAVALVFWLGMTLLVVNGNIFEDDALPDREYLGAAAHPGDSYYEYYQNTLPEELTSLEIYTSRMVTVDEYLQLRAILSKVTGAKLYVYKSAFDTGYSLELSYGYHEPAVVNYLMPAASERYGFMLGIQQHGSPSQYSPVAMYMDNKFEKRGQMAVFTTSIQPKYSLDFQQLTPEELGNDLLVYVNGERIDLINTKVKVGPLTGVDKSKVTVVRVNGVNVSTLGAAIWPEVLVEGRTLLSPLKRMEKLLNVGSPYSGVSFNRSKPCEGTFRKWYDGLGYLKDQPILTYYNDRQVSLDFLLDTEFGDNAMIQHGAVYDTQMGRYALQVLDDYPDVMMFFGGPRTMMSKNKPGEREFQRETPVEIDLATLYDGKAIELDLFFKRLPMPAEVDQLNVYLEQVLKESIRIFQDCTKPDGDYSLQLGTARNIFFGFEAWPAGSRQENPVRLQVVKNGSGDSGSATFRPAPLPEGAPNADVLLRINGAWVSVHSAGAIPFTSATLDAGPLKTKMKCLLGLNPENIDAYNVWTATQTLKRSLFGRTLVGDEVRKTIAAQKLEGLPIRYFIEDGEVAADIFARLPAVRGIKLSMASRTEGPDDQVIARVDY